MHAANIYTKYIVCGQLVIPPPPPPSQCSMSHDLAEVVHLVHGSSSVLRPFFVRNPVVSDMPPDLASLPMRMAFYVDPSADHTSPSTSAHSPRPRLVEAFRELDIIERRKHEQLRTIMWLIPILAHHCFGSPVLDEDVHDILSLSHFEASQSSHLCTAMARLLAAKHLVVAVIKSYEGLNPPVDPFLAVCNPQKGARGMDAEYDERRTSAYVTPFREMVSSNGEPTPEALRNPMKLLYVQQSSIVA